MGQFTLGLRSLLIKAAVFVVMAALLAWALGGTLWPKPVVAKDWKNSVEFNGPTYLWRMTVGGKNSGEVRWTLLAQIPHRRVPIIDEGWWDVAGPIVADGALYVGGLSGLNGDQEEMWHIERITMPQPLQPDRTRFRMPDRLAVEQQLERLKTGLPLQDAETILRQRAAVLDPK